MTAKLIVFQYQSATTFTYREPMYHFQGRPTLSGVFREEWKTAQELVRAGLNLFILGSFPVISRRRRHAQTTSHSLVRAGARKCACPETFGSPRYFGPCSVLSILAIRRSHQLAPFVRLGARSMSDIEIFQHLTVHFSRCTFLITGSWDKVSSTNLTSGSSAAIFPLPVSRSQIDRRFSTTIRHSPSSFPGLSALPLTHR